MNKLREKIENKEKIRGTLVSLTDPCLCEIMGDVGYDCVWIDMEHTYISYKDALCHLNGARSSGIPAIIRVPQSDLTVTKKILEMDPDGIVFPMLRDIDEIKNVIGMTLYPPLGTRGFGPMRAIRYGEDSAKDYVDKKSLELCRFIQIEHIDCVDRLEEIVDIPYIDGFIFGPNDLSASVGDFLNVFGEKTLSQMEKAVKILRAHGKYFGIACGFDRKTLESWQRFEPDCFFAGADWNFVYSAAKDTLSRLTEIMK